MFKTLDEAVALAKELTSSLTNVKSRVMIAPPFTSLWGVKQVLKGSNILLGAQNMGPEEWGAHTGEVSPLMLQDLGVEIVILGHSERRHAYGESDQLINTKVKKALEHGLEAILCVGETLEEREAGFTEKIVEGQMRSGLKDVSEGHMKRVTIAYEPVWAIGTGKTATPQDADGIHGFIRKLLSELYSRELAENQIIQYGGSVKPGNVKELMAMENIDGALVGGASLSGELFIPIVKFDQ